MSTALALPQNAIVVRHELDVSEVIAQVKKIQLVMEQVMKEGEHYGVIPGTNKPTLLKPGAEKLLLTFRFDPQYESTETYEGKHLTVKSKCVLYHITTGMRMGSGEGSCSTKESKYAYRKGARVCPECGKETIIKGKTEYGGGWLCFGKKGGCGAKWKDGDAVIEGQSTDRVPNEDLADQYNTVLKMSNKRALVAAVLNVTAASDIFTQDLEDSDVGGRGGTDPNPRTMARDGSPEPRTEGATGQRGNIAPADPEDHRQESETLLLTPEEDRGYMIGEIKRLARLIPDKDRDDAKVTYGVGKTLESTDTAVLSDYLKWMQARAKK
jgi:hypothetical protein